LKQSKIVSCGFQIRVIVDAVMKNGNSGAGTILADMI